MSTPTHEVKISITEAEFVEIYGNYPVDLPDMPDGFTINEALKYEEEMCDAKPDRRFDEKLRLNKLAEYVGLTALLPEHRELYPEDKK